MRKLRFVNMKWAWPYCTVQTLRLSNKQTPFSFTWKWEGDHALCPYLVYVCIAAVLWCVCVPILRRLAVALQCNTTCSCQTGGFEINSFVNNTVFKRFIHIIAQWMNSFRGVCHLGHILGLSQAWRRHASGSVLTRIVLVCVCVFVKAFVHCVSLYSVSFQPRRNEGANMQL